MLNEVMKRDFPTVFLCDNEVRMHRSVRRQQFHWIPTDANATVRFAVLRPVVGPYVFTSAMSSSAATASSSMTAAATDAQRLSSAAKLQLLRDHMLRPARHPAVVLLCATQVLKEGGGSEFERAAITELAVLSALDLGNTDVAEEMFNSLVRKFGRKSVRVQRLIGMQHEAQGQTEAAMKLYQDILREHPTEQFCGRRLCAIQRGRGEYKLAIEALKQTKIYRDPKEDKEFTYAEMYPLDEAAARELIGLNWLVNNVSECIRYADECVLFDAASYLHHVRLAELCCVAGQLERSATAYAQSLRLNDGKNNTRALYGLWHVAQQLVSSSRKRSGNSRSGQVDSHQNSSATVADAAALVEFAETRLRLVYSGAPTLSYLDLTLKAE